MHHNCGLTDSLNAVHRYLRFRAYLGISLSQGERKLFNFFSGSAGGHALLATLLALRLHFLGTSSNVASIGACKRNKVGVTAMSDFQQ